ncbi:MAG: hypothetical protein R3Y32_06675 [Bacillota bacterium]
MKKFSIGILFLIMLFNYQILSTDYGLITTDTSSININSLSSAVNTLTGISSIKYYQNPIGENYFVIVTHQSNGYLFTATHEDILALETISLLASSALGSLASQYNPILVKTMHPLIYLVILIIIITAPTKSKIKKIQAEEPTTHKELPDIIPPTQQIIEEKNDTTEELSPESFEYPSIFANLKILYSSIFLKIILLIAWGSVFTSLGYYIYYTKYINMRNNGIYNFYIKDSAEKQLQSLQYLIITFLCTILLMLIIYIIKRPKEKT